MASEIQEGKTGEECTLQHVQQPSILELPSRQHEMPGRPTQAANSTRVKAHTTSWWQRKQPFQLNNLQDANCCKCKDTLLYHQATTPATGTRCPTHHGGANKTLFTHSNPHTIADANPAAIIVRCMASEMRGGETQGWNVMQHTITQACLSCPHASMKILAGPLKQPKYTGLSTYNIMVPTKEQPKN